MLATPTVNSPAVARPRYSRPTSGRAKLSPKATRHPLHPQGGSLSMRRGQGCNLGPDAGLCSLTDRGLAVIILTGVLIMVAAATVVGLTAWRVTGSDYIPYGHSAAAHL